MTKMVFGKTNFFNIIKIFIVSLRRVREGTSSNLRFPLDLGKFGLRHCGTRHSRHSGPGVKETQNIKVLWERCWEAYSEGYKIETVVVFLKSV